MEDKTNKHSLIVILSFIGLLSVLLLVTHILSTYLGESIIPKFPPPYAQLAEACRTSGSPSCCVASVKEMQAGSHQIATNGSCPPGYAVNTLGCIGSYKWCTVGQAQIKIRNYVEPDGVEIKADRSFYKDGEEIKIEVRNNLPQPIYYNPVQRFWSVEYREGGAWKLLGLKAEEAFQFSDDKAEQSCGLMAYELTSPSELAAGQLLTGTWRQNICDLNSQDDLKDNAGVVRRIKTGVYRLSFKYSLENSGNQYEIKNAATVYSQPFELK